MVLGRTEDGTTLGHAITDPAHPVQEILGHSDVRTTQGYTHIGSEVARDAARRMDSALWGDDA